MNQMKFYSELLLHYLYKRGSISTYDMEKMFASLKGGDEQTVNNIICNRYESTSYIKQGLLQYDEVNHILSITQKGRKEIESRYGK